MERLEINVRIGTEEYKFEKGITYQEIARQFQDNYKQDIVLLFVNGKLQELHKVLENDCELEFITTDTNLGIQAYKRSMGMLYIKSVYDVLGREAIDHVNLLFAVSTGYYTLINGRVDINQNVIDQITARMKELIEKDLPITKRSVHTDEALQLFNEYEMNDKEKLFNYRRVSRVNLYKIDDFEDYYYGYMVPSTGLLKWFQLIPFEGGIVLQMPRREEPRVVPAFEPREKLFRVQYDAIKWGNILGINTVGELNECITKSDVRELILVQEAKQEKRIAEIAGEIAKMKEKKFILIAGPSSSGKTTFSHRLSVQLRVNGVIPHPIAVDNYFVNRVETPLDENGMPNYECLEAIDVDKFNEDLTSLLKGEEVELPTFNFKTGCREYNGNKLKLKEGEVLVIEGIHGLNDELTRDLPMENKYKIYISALTQLNIDEHNRIPTTDGRLIRRMVRDARTRGASGKKTIGMWNSVRRGEEDYIFPFQESADVMFNSALIYELAVLKQFAEPILFGIEKDCPEYLEAKRLLKFLDYFVGIPTDYIPMNSLLKEFVGNGCFEI